MFLCYKHMYFVIEQSDKTNTEFRVAPASRVYPKCIYLCISFNVWIFSLGGFWIIGRVCILFSQLDSKINICNVKNGTNFIISSKPQFKFLKIVLLVFNLLGFSFRY